MAQIDRQVMKSRICDSFHDLDGRRLEAGVVVWLLVWLLEGRFGAWDAVKWRSTKQRRGAQARKVQPYKLRTELWASRAC